jgi:exodeoxyribonuclease VII large subunit
MSQTSLPLQSNSEVFTVSQFNALVRDLLEINFTDIWIEGEISNLRKYPSGHYYFTLKDESSEINAVMFAGMASHLDFEPEDGMHVIGLGTATVYLERGRYQIIVRRMKPAGLGKLQLAFEKLKERLKTEGLFDEERKRLIPVFPERIGVVTSAEGAAIRDILSILRRRYPLVEVLLFPVKVQGEGAAAEIAAGIEAANRYHASKKPIDTLIVGRGGGSIEDLWAFNEEAVARAIFSSQIPVISAVGHEVDFTIADFVADLRAATPSAAAELVVPDRQEVVSLITQRLSDIQAIVQGRLQDFQTQLDLLLSSYAFRRPIQRLREFQQRLDHLSDLMLRSFRAHNLAIQERFEKLFSRLEAVNPVAVMRRGYSVVQDQSGRLIKSIEQINLHERVNVRLHQGALLCEVLEKIESSKQEA